MAEVLQLLEKLEQENKKFLEDPRRPGAHSAPKLAQMPLRVWTNILLRLDCDSICALALSCKQHYNILFNVMRYLCTLSSSVVPTVLILPLHLVFSPNKSPKSTASAALPASPSLVQVVSSEASSSGLQSGSSTSKSTSSLPNPFFDPPPTQPAVLTPQPGLPVGQHSTSSQGFKAPPIPTSGSADLSDSGTRRSTFSFLQKLDNLFGYHPPERRSLEGTVLQKCHNPQCDGRVRFFDMSQATLKCPMCSTPAPLPMRFRTDIKYMAPRFRAEGRGVDEWRCELGAGTRWPLTITFYYTEGSSGSAVLLHVPCAPTTGMADLAAQVAGDAGRVLNVLLRAGAATDCRAMLQGARATPPPPVAVRAEDLALSVRLGRRGEGLLPHAGLLCEHISAAEADCLVARVPGLLHTLSVSLAT